MLYRLEDPDNARSALTAARSLEEKDSLFNPNPFLNKLMERTLDIVLEEAFKEGAQEDLEASEQDDENPPSGLILP
jgi:hypothetical protein